MVSVSDVSVSDVSGSDGSGSGVVLFVEGESDRRAVEVAAARLSVDLAAVEVVAMGGITNLASRLAAVRRGSRVTGLYDAAQAGYVRAVLHRTRIEAPFFACEADLEDELIRALGPARVHEVIARAGDAASYAILRNQPFHRERAEQDVLRRFMGTTSGRKLKYAGLLTAALTPAEVPGPLTAVLSEATR